MKAKHLISVGTSLLTGILFFYLALSGINDIKQLQTKTTNLSEEKINEFKLMDKSIDVREEYNLERPHIQTEEEEGWIGYQYGHNSNVYIQTDLNDQITIFDFSLSKFRTSRNIDVGTNINEVEKEYGKNNYKITSGQGLYVIGYIDRVKEIRLEFYYSDKKVREISISKLKSVNGDRKFFDIWI